ncbi:MAG TPA: hypothetical protein PK056_06885 [Methylotenera sp.]|nr:hypothetical protein [Methylotenera sp.]
MTIEQSKISLVLSGGGMRAMVFHLGVLKFFKQPNDFCFSITMN